MSYPQTPAPKPIGIPTAGMNTRDSLEAMDPRYAPWIENFEPDAQSLSVRGGWQIHATLSDEDRVRKLATYGEDNLFAYCENSVANNRIYDVTSDGSQASGDAVHTTTGSGNVLRLGSAYYAGRAGFVSADTPSQYSRVWDGSSWAAPGFQYSAVDIASYIYKSYRGRVYLFYENYVYYSALAGVTGACSRFDTSHIFEGNGDILWAEELTSPRNLDSETLLAFGNQDGEVLVYGGDNPDAANWSIVAKFKIGRPLYWNACLGYRNDILVLTEDGIVSIRALMQGSADAFDEYAITGAITPYWIAYTKALKEQIGSLFTSLARIDFWPVRNRIYVQLAGHLNQDGTYTNAGLIGTLFVYNTVTGAWAVHTVPIVTGNSSLDMVYFNNALYRSTDNLILKYDLDAIKDEDPDDPGNYTAIDFDLQSAYTNLGSSNKYKDVKGFEPIMTTDFSESSVEMRCAIDFGRNVTDAVTAELEDGFNNPLYRTGGMGTYIQYRFQGSTDTSAEDGLTLFSMGVVAE